MKLCSERPGRKENGCVKRLMALASQAEKPSAPSNRDLSCRSSSQNLTSCIDFDKALLHGGSDGKESAHNGETQVRSLGQEDPLEKEMTTYSSIPAGECYGSRTLD